MFVLSIFLSCLFDTPLGIPGSSPDAAREVKCILKRYPKWWFSKGIPLIAGKFNKSRLVRYFNLARYMIEYKKALVRDTNQPINQPIVQEKSSHEIFMGI